MVTSLRSKWAVGKAVRAGLAIEGAYLNRYVTDEQRSRRPIFNATLRAAASWLFFCVARSTRMTQIWALRSRLEKQPTGLRRHHHYMRDGACAHGGGRWRRNRKDEPLSPKCVRPRHFGITVHWRAPLDFMQDTLI